MPQPTAAHASFRAPRQRRNPATKLARQSDPVAGRRLAGRWSAANSNAVSCASCAAPRLPWRAARHLPSMSTRTPPAPTPRAPATVQGTPARQDRPRAARRRHDRTFSEWEAGHCEAARYPARDAWTPLASGVPQLFVVGSRRSDTGRVRWHGAGSARCRPGSLPAPRGGILYGFWRCGPSSLRSCADETDADVRARQQRRLRQRCSDT